MKKLSRIILLFLLPIAVFALLACGKSFVDQNGHAVDLKNHPGRWLVLNYWAPWCEPCKHELPEINHFYLVHRSHVDVYGVDYDHPSAAKLKALSKKLGLDYPLLVEDPGHYLHLQEIQGLPITFIFDPKGHLVKTLEGPQTGETIEAVILGK